MWYVIQVSGGQEEGTARLMQKRIPGDILTECFIPRKERKKKFKGIWRQVEADEASAGGDVFLSAFL